jgi:hypothetical protein
MSGMPACRCDVCGHYVHPEDMNYAAFTDADVCRACLDQMEREARTVPPVIGTVDPLQAGAVMLTLADMERAVASLYFPHGQVKGHG